MKIKVFKEVTRTYCVEIEAESIMAANKKMESLDSSDNLDSEDWDELSMDGVSTTFKPDWSQEAE